MSLRFEAYIEKYQELKALRLDFVTVTLVKILGSAPQDLGARMIVSHEGLFWGTVGGGKIENHMIKKAQELLFKPGLYLQELEVNLQNDIGMSCGGAVGFLLEAERADSRWSIAVFGAGHVAQELIPLLLPLEARIQCFDTRKEWIDRLPTAAHLSKSLVEDMAGQVAALSEKTFLVSITMGHSSDLPILDKALQRKFPFIGVIGSELKAKKLAQELLSLGHAEQSVSRMVCPLGLKLGTNAPYEIAVSILAQLIQERDKSLLE